MNTHYNAYTTKYTIKDNPVLNNNNEIWKPIDGFTKLYEVSNTGKVRNMRGKILKTYKINSGYYALKFTVLGVRISHLVHRLVAKAFIVNTDNKKEVKHIDEDKSNNHMSNLEWVTSSENKQHSIKSGRYSKIYTTRNTLGKKHKSTVSKYHNVGFDKNRNKWTGCVRNQSKTYGWKRFDTEEEAALHVNYLLDKYKFTDRPKNIVI